MDSNMCKRT